MAATWSISLDRADAISPPGLAGPAMALIALLAPGGVPGAVLTTQAACDFICGRHATGRPPTRARSGACWKAWPGSAW